MEKYDCLKLENQLCFPLYACSKEITRKYKPLLDKLDLTYTQYIAMMFLWEHKEANVKTLGEALFLDSGTLSPLLKTLESKGFVERERNKQDERNLVIKLTKKGENLREKAVDVPPSIAKCVNLSANEAQMLYNILYKILNGGKDSGKNN
ncbi:MAG: MarR family transcriptional regulator [Clostridia bacterium]|nr:MarR family transcriptional regulator [Clostridia bacterium]